MCKNLLVIILLSVVIATVTGNMAIQAAQETGITVIVNGEPVIFDQQPLIINDRVMVPIRFVAEKMGWTVLVKSPTVFEFINSVKYTDGSQEYLFSCHSSTIDIEKGHLNRSIMVGVGRFFDTDDDHKIKLTATPVIINNRTLVGIRDLAKCLYADVEWDGVTKTVNVKSGEIPYYNGQGLPNRDELIEGMRTWHKITGQIVRVGEEHLLLPTEPYVITLSTQMMPRTPSFVPTGIFTSAPKIGSVPAKILLPGKTDLKKQDSYYEPYKYNIGLGCNWYSVTRSYI